MIKYEIVFLSMSKIHGCIILNNLKVNDKERKKEIVHEENKKVMVNYVIHFNSMKWDLVYYLVSLDFRYLQFQKKKIKQVVIGNTKNPLYVPLLKCNISFS